MKKTFHKQQDLIMINMKLPEQYAPYEKVWICGNTFNYGKILIEVEGNPIFLIGKNSKGSLVWLNYPKPIGGKPKWVKAIDANNIIEPDFDIFESSFGNEISVKGIPLIHYKAKNDTLIITLINLIPIGLNIYGGLRSLRFSGNVLENNTFENVHTMIGIGK